MTPSRVPDPHRTENTILRALFTQLQALVPPDTPAAKLLATSSVLFDPSAPPTPQLEEPDDIELDPVAATLRSHPQSIELNARRTALVHTLRHLVPASAWRTFLEYEQTTAEQADFTERVVFDHAFRLGQLWPPVPDTSTTQANPLLRRLIRAATDLRTPPGQRLRVLLSAAIQAIEELYPVQHAS